MNTVEIIFSPTGGTEKIATSSVDNGAKAP